MFPRYTFNELINDIPHIFIFIPPSVLIVNYKIMNVEIKMKAFKRCDNIYTLTIKHWSCHIVWYWCHWSGTEWTRSRWTAVYSFSSQRLLRRCIALCKSDTVIVSFCNTRIFPRSQLVFISFKQNKLTFLLNVL